MNKVIPYNQLMYQLSMPLLQWKLVSKDVQAENNFDFLLGNYTIHLCSARYLRFIMFRQGNGQLYLRGFNSRQEIQDSAKKNFDFDIEVNHDRESILNYLHLISLILIVWMSQLIESWSV